MIYMFLMTIWLSGGLIGLMLGVKMGFKEGFEECRKKIWPQN